MTRAEHLQWCKDRALEYVRQGDLTNALASMVSDLSKHKETAGHAGIEMGVMLAANGHLSSPHDMKQYIEGFN
jgi:hypothetical protein